MNDTNQTKPGFTPGPWKRVWRKGCEIRPSYYVIEHGQSGEVVCETDNDEPNQYHDACLIAASPDLYEALDKLVAELDAIRPDAMDEDMDSMPAARAALAKARGGSA